MIAERYQELCVMSNSQLAKLSKEVLLEAFGQAYVGAMSGRISANERANHNLFRARLMVIIYARMT